MAGHDERLNWMSLVISKLILDAGGSVEITHAERQELTDTAFHLDRIELEDRTVYRLTKSEALAPARPEPKKGLPSPARDDKPPVPGTEWG